MNYEKKIRVPKNTVLRENKSKEFGGTSYRILKNGMIEITYILPGKPRPNNNMKFYIEERDDYIRLTINTNPIYVENNKLYECYVVYFSHSFDDTINFFSISDISNTRVEYKEQILTKIDENLLLTDKKYLEFLMRNLLDKNRIKKYAEYRKNKNSQTKCGRYIGEVRYDNKGKLIKYFDENIGNICHYNEQKIQEIEEQEKRRKLLEIYNEQINDLEEQLKRKKEEREELLEQLFQNSDNKRKSK